MSLDNFLYVFEINQEIEIFDALNLSKPPKVGDIIFFDKDYLPSDDLFNDLMDNNGSSYAVEKIKKEPYLDKLYYLVFLKAYII